MSGSVGRCISKIFSVITAPIRALLMEAILLLFIEIFKFCLVLLLAFSMGYISFYFWNFNTENRPSLTGSLKKDRLSAGLIEDGSFSKYPFVIELPTKSSGESIKNNKKLRIYGKQAEDVKRQQ